MLSQKWLECEWANLHSTFVCLFVSLCVCVCVCVCLCTYIYVCVCVYEHALVCMSTVWSDLYVVYKLYRHFCHCVWTVYLSKHKPDCIVSKHSYWLFVSVFPCVSSCTTTERDIIIISINMWYLYWLRKMGHWRTIFIKLVQWMQTSSAISSATHESSYLYIGDALLRLQKKWHLRGSVI